MTNRMNEQKWLQHGLLALSERGFRTLKADLMAKELNVTRGSFYWHFADINAFHERVISLWQDQETQQVIDGLNELTCDTSKSRALVRLAFKSDMRLERSIRSWAEQNTKVADAAKVVDERRIEFLAALLIAEGLPNALATPRAHFLYLGYLGRAAIAEFGRDSFADADLDAIIDLFLMPQRD